MVLQFHTNYELFQNFILQQHDTKSRLIKNTCDDKDGDEYINCAKATLEEFFKEHSAGVPDQGIKPMDPATIEHIEVLEKSINIKFSFLNLTVTGFKDVKVSDFTEAELKKDKDYKVTMTLKFDFVAEGPIKITILNKDKSFTGNTKYEGGAVIVTTHVYETKTVDHNDRKYYYEIGPEVATCESQHAKVTANEELRKEIDNDPELKSGHEEYAKIEKEHQARVVCEIAKAVTKTVIENLRVTARKP